MIKPKDIYPIGTEVIVNHPDTDVFIGKVEDNTKYSDLKIVRAECGRIYLVDITYMEIKQTNMDMHTLSIEDVKAIALKLGLVLKLGKDDNRGTPFTLKTLELDDPDQYELYKHDNYQKQELNRKRRQQFKKGFKNV